MKKTILYFTGIYDTLDLFTEHLREAFEAMGYASFVYDVRYRQQSERALLELLRDAVARGSVTDGCTGAGIGRREACPESEGAALPAFGSGAWPDLPGADLGSAFTCVTFNNLGYNLTLPGSRSGKKLSGAAAVSGEIFADSQTLPDDLLRADGENLWDAYGIPYIDILMDHPFHYEKPLRNLPGTAVVLCTDRNHVRYIRKHFKHIRQADFLPHAGVELGSRHKPLRDRGIDVLYAGALPIYTVGKMIPDLSSIPEVDGGELAQEVLGELIRHPKRTTEEVIEECLRARRNDLSPERIQELVVLLRFLDSYAVSFFREQAVRLLVESGIQVTAYGTGWDQCEWSGNPSLSYGGKVTAPQILPLMNDAKIVLNTMTWFKAGAHDRIFNGMLAGAAVVTDDSTWLRREFTDGRELAMFSLEEIAGLPERVFDLFGHLNRAQQVADCGLCAARAGHTWRNRAEYLAECGWV